MNCCYLFPVPPSDGYFRWRIGEIVGIASQDIPLAGVTKGQALTITRGGSFESVEAIDTYLADLNA